MTERLESRKSLNDAGRCSECGCPNGWHAGKCLTGLALLLDGGERPWRDGEPE